MAKSNPRPNGKGGSKSPTPNLPAKTGNESGKGRGNAPSKPSPKRGRSARIRACITFEIPARILAGPEIVIRLGSQL